MRPKNNSRRAFLQATGASILLPTLAGCSEVASSGSEMGPETGTSNDVDGLDFAAAWEFQSEKPILEHSALSHSDSSEMVSGTIVDTESEAQRVRWDYLKDISTDFTSHFTDTAFAEGEFLVVVETLLPASHTIQDEDVELVGGTLHMKYDIVPSDDDSKRLTVSNALEKWRTADTEKPSEVTVELHYDGSKR